MVILGLPLCVLLCGRSSWNPRNSIYIKYKNIVITSLGLCKPLALHVDKIFNLFKVALHKENAQELNRKITFVCCCSDHIDHII
jgi:hypothetical protein